MIVLLVAILLPAVAWSFQVMGIETLCVLPVVTFTSPRTESWVAEARVTFSVTKRTGKLTGLLSVDGATLGKLEALTQPNADGSFTTILSDLQPGPHTITVTVNGGVERCDASSWTFPEATLRFYLKNLPDLYPVWDAFEESDCQDILKFASADSLPWSDFQFSSMNGRVRRHKELLLPLDKNSPTWWIAVKIWAFFQAVNQDNWRFDISSMEQIRLIRYQAAENQTQQVDYDDWHADMAPTGLSAYRKLTAVVQVSKSHSGGMLQLLTSTGGKNFKGGQGSMAMFPSYMMYRTSPVTSGFRYALVAHAIGSETFV